MTEGKTTKGMGRRIDPPYSPMNNMEVPPELANDPETKSEEVIKEAFNELELSKGFPTVKGWRTQTSEKPPKTQQPTAAEETDK